MSQTFTGIVVSTKMNKTIVVDIRRMFQHPRYRKVIVRHKRMKVHCEDQAVKVGDVVDIQQTRPISREKHFIFVKIVKTAEGTKPEVKKETAEAAKTVKAPKEEKPVKKVAAKKKSTTGRAAAKKAAK
jgi:small subunit ribosomal protein S17